MSTPRAPKPGALAGYSGTPLPKKLGIATGRTVLLVGAPAGFEGLLVPLPEGAVVRRRGGGSAAVVILFVRSLADLERRFVPAAERVADGGRVWIAWPKKASGLQSDVSEAEVRRFGLAHAFVDYKICAIDSTWSGLCFARRQHVGKARRA